MGIQKYLTEEERLKAKKEVQRRWREKHKEQISKYYKENREKILENRTKYYEKNKTQILNYQQKYYINHKDEIIERTRKYYQENKDKIAETKAYYQLEWRKTQIGRASYLVGNYKRHDKKSKRGECTLTPQWIVDNIFSSKCIYCGKDDWTELGCDRIDNSKPHTPDNVVCCCEECNVKKGTKSYEEFKKEIQNSSIYVSIQ